MIHISAGRWPFKSFSTASQLLINPHNRQHLIMVEHGEISVFVTYSAPIQNYFVTTISAAVHQTYIKHTAGPRYGYPQIL